jgi:hypothetical protein
MKKIFIFAFCACFYLTASASERKLAVKIMFGTDLGLPHINLSVLPNSTIATVKTNIESVLRAGTKRKKKNVLQACNIDLQNEEQSFAGTDTLKNLLDTKALQKDQASKRFILYAMKKSETKA